ncbi:hypothetical protein BDR22DRAFT_858969 [Usnea florida]
MKTSPIPFTLLYLAALTRAAPPRSSNLIARQGNVSCDGYVEIRFLAAGTGPDDPDPPEFDQLFPTDGSAHAISNPLVVDIMYLVCRGDCNVTAMDGHVVDFGGRDPGYVLPQQRVVSAECRVY